MADRDVTRNGRGQIVSYEIAGVSDSTQETLQYGKVFLPTFENGATKSEKLTRNSLTDNINTSFSDELITPDSSVNPQVLIEETITIDDYEYVTNGSGDFDPNDGQGDGPNGGSGG